jgi:AcrR family transcriptional regulator
MGRSVQLKVIRYNLWISCYNRKMGKRKTTDKFHHGSLKETLIASAIKFLQKNPVESLSMKTLALSAGVSQPAPYRHFKSRDELLAAISEQGFDIQFRYMLEAYMANRENPGELYHCLAQAFFRMGLDYPQHFKLMLSSHIVPSEKYPALLLAAGRNYALLKKMVETCQTAGIVGPGDPYHKSMHCWSLVTGFTTLYAEGRLEWLGVTPKNAQLALRILVDQYRLGSQSALKENKGFAPFKSDFSAPHLVCLKDAERELDKVLNPGAS